MVAKNMKVLKEVDLLENFRNSFYHFFPLFFILLFFPGGRGRKGGKGGKDGRSTRMRLAGGHCFVVTILVSCSRPTKSGIFSLVHFSFYFIYFPLSKDQ